MTATAQPLIDIRPARHAQAVQQAHALLAGDSPAVQAVMFVSAAAVTHFLIATTAYHYCRNSLKSFQNGSLRAWATGQGTVKALLAAGVPPGQIDAPDHAAGQWDSEALWQRLQPSLAAVRHVLVVRGADCQGLVQGRDWLSQQLRSAGMAVQAVAAYERHVPIWTDAERALASPAAEQVWLFSSSEAIANLQQLMPAADWHATRALATHPRIAQAARAAGFGVVYESRPGLSQIIASIKSLQ